MNSSSCELIDIGEIWAVTLHGVLSAIVSKLGYNANAATSPDAKEGNVVYLHLFIDALALQPCNPTSTFLLSFIFFYGADGVIFFRSGASTCSLDPS